MNKWSAQIKQVMPGKITGYKILEEGKTLSYQKFLDHLLKSEEFTLFFNNLLSKAPYSAFRWETPGVSPLTLEKDFSFVLVNSPGLNRTADKDTFAEHFKENDSISISKNLGGDALMIIPTLASCGSEYRHLADFVKSAPKDVIQKLWKTVAESMFKQVQTKKCWLSTAGAGVSWLHVRIDSRPKYYAYSGYRN